MAPQKLDPVVGDAERLQYGELFHAMVRDPGWAVFVKLIERRRRNIGDASLDDTPRQQKYWRGRRDELDELLQEVYSLVEEIDGMESVEPEVVAAMTGQRIAAAPSDDNDDDDLEEG